MDFMNCTVSLRVFIAFYICCELYTECSYTRCSIQL